MKTLIVLLSLLTISSTSFAYSIVSKDRDDDGKVYYYNLLCDNGGKKGVSLMPVDNGYAYYSKGVEYKSLKQAAKASCGE